MVRNSRAACATRWTRDGLNTAVNGRIADFAPDASDFTGVAT